MGRLIAPDGPQTGRTFDVLDPHYLGVLQSEAPAVNCGHVISNHALDGVDDDLVRPIADTVNVPTPSARAEAEVTVTLGSPLASPIPSARGSVWLISLLTFS